MDDRRRLVSIVLPVYNGEKYLRESIDSVIAQTYQNWELLILDDCSVDHTCEIAQNYVRRDERIHYYRNEKNLKLPGNLNKGFSIARGEYLTWTSDDNRYAPTSIEKMVRKMESEDAIQFVYASCRIIDDSGKEIEYIMVNENSPKMLVATNSVGACFLYTRKVYETIGDYRSEFMLVEDFDYWQRVYAQFKMAVLPEILYYYRWHDGALTSTMNKEKFYTNLEKMLLANHGLYKHLSLEQLYLYYHALSDCRNKRSADNPYKLQNTVLTCMYTVCYRIPRKIIREMKKL